MLHNACSNSTNFLMFLPERYLHYACGIVCEYLNEAMTTILSQEYRYAKFWSCIEMFYSLSLKFERHKKEGTARACG